MCVVDNFVFVDVVANFVVVVYIHNDDVVVVANVVDIDTFDVVDNVLLL